SVICTPMLVRGRALGVITFVTSESGRRFDTSDLELAQEISRRAAVAVENASLFKEVRESEERFRRLYESNLVGVAFWNADGCITSANDAYLQVAGLTREEFEREAELRWETNEASEPRGTALSRAYEPGVFEKEFVHPDGSRVPALVAAA